MYDVVLYEVFEEEKIFLKECMPLEIKAKYISATIQEKEQKNLLSSLISVRTQSLIPKEWASSVSGILTRSTGYEHVLAYQKGTNTKALCGYLPSYCARAVAEQAILLMMGLLRKLPLQMRQFNKFTRDGMTGVECKGRKLLVVGVGRIGSEIVDIAQGLGMVVKGVDIKHKKKGLTYVSLEKGIAWAQSVICATTLTEQTRGMFNYNLFKKATVPLVFVNIARGEISLLQDLKRAFDQGVLSGAALDVYEEESTLAALMRKQKSRVDSRISLLKELQQKQNVIFTPHNAFNTQEALRKKAEQTVEAITMFLETKTFPSRIPKE